MFGEINGMNSYGRMSVRIQHTMADRDGQTKDSAVDGDFKDSMGPVVSHTISVYAENENATGSEAQLVRMATFTLDLPALARMGLETEQFNANDWVGPPNGNEIFSLDSRSISQSFMKLLGQCLVYEADRTEFQDNHVIIPSHNAFIN